MTVGYYLYDHSPASPQFYDGRNSPPTWAVSVHTSEGPGGPGAAASLAGFIARRSDPGSYAVVVDAWETIELVPPTATTFSVAASGYNSRTYAVCIAGRSADLSPDDPYTLACIDRLGAVIANTWAWAGVDPNYAAAWIGTDALERPGLFCHGDVQPWDRSDAWTNHPDRPALDRLLVDSILYHSQTPRPPRAFPKDAEPMRRFIRPQSSPRVYLIDAGCLGRKAVESEEHLKDYAYACRVSGVPILDPPADGITEVIAGERVWVVSDRFAASIPEL